MDNAKDSRPRDSKSSFRFNSSENASILVMQPAAILPCKRWLIQALTGFHELSRHILH